MAVTTQLSHNNEAGFINLTLLASLGNEVNVVFHVDLVWCDLDLEEKAVKTTEC